MILEAHIKIPRIIWNDQGVFFIQMLLINLSYLSSITSRLLRAGMFKILFYFNVFLFPSLILMRLVFLDRTSYAGTVGTFNNSVDLSVQDLRAFLPETSTNLSPSLNLSRLLVSIDLM